MSLNDVLTEGETSTHERKKNETRKTVLFKFKMNIHRTLGCFFLLFFFNMSLSHCANFITFDSFSSLKPIFSWLTMMQTRKLFGSRNF